MFVKLLDSEHANLLETGLARRISHGLRTIQLLLLLEDLDELCLSHGESLVLHGQPWTNASSMSMDFRTLLIHLHHYVLFTLAQS